MITNNVDAHHHFWIYDPIEHKWINDKMTAIRRNFLPEDLEPVLNENGISETIVVQVAQNEAENEFQLRNAEQYDFVKGVVGWIDLRDEKVEEKLSHYKRFKKLKGFRHVLQAETDRALMLRPSFMRGIDKLRYFEYTFDILIYADQLKYVEEFVSAFPDQLFVIDHIAKPNIRKREIDEWRKGIQRVANHQNVYCKISGMVTEADWFHWKKDDFKPYIDTVVNSFGINRIMYGSDWPVCLVAGSYREVKDIVDDYFSYFTLEEQEKFFRKNAIKFYNL